MSHTHISTHPNVGVNFFVHTLKILFFSFFVLFSFGGTVQATTISHLETFDTTTDLTDKFNDDGAPQFTNINNAGINDTGSIDVPLGSNDIWTTKQGYSVSGAGDKYTFSAYFKIKANSGRGGLGFSNSDTNTANATYGAPEKGIGVTFHGGGGEFINNRSVTTLSWPPDLVLGDWYWMTFEVTAKGSDTYDLKFQIWETDATGTIGVMKTEKTMNDVVNADLGSASTIHGYFSASGSRMEKIDDFKIELEGGAAFVEEGEPVVLTTDPSSITGSGATSGGDVTDDNGSSVTNRGVCWSTSTAPTVADSCTTDGTGTGSYISTLTGLSSATTYYVRAYATNAIGTTYGSEKSFTTTIALDTTGPTPTINQNAEQEDPTATSPVKYDIVFDEPIDVTTFTVDDISTSSSTASGVNVDTLVEIAPNDGTAFQASISATGDGDIIATVATETVRDVAGNLNDFDSLSTDNSVTLDLTVEDAVCVFDPSSAPSGTAVEISCSGIETGGMVIISGAECGGESGGTVVCSGLSQDIGSSPRITTKDALDNTSIASGTFTAQEDEDSYKEEESDADGDGNPDSVESLAPNGDGNGDGIADAEQSDVATQQNTDTGSYTTLEAKGGCNVISGYTVVSESSLAVQDDAYDYPVGLNNFTLQCSSPGQSADVVFYYDKEYDTSEWLFKKYNSTGEEYSDISNVVTYGTVVVNGVSVTTASYTVTDGGDTDTDGSANGVIIDPAGPAYAPMTICSADERADIKGDLWLDVNSNGEFDREERGVSDVTVVLKNQSGDIVAEDDTNDDGQYRFNGIDAGDYTIDIDLGDNELNGLILTSERGKNLNGKVNFSHECDDDFTKADFGFSDQEKKLATTGTNVYVWLILLGCISCGLVYSTRQRKLCNQSK